MIANSRHAPLTTAGTIDGRGAHSEVGNGSGGLVLAIVWHQAATHALGSYWSTLIRHRRRLAVHLLGLVN